MIIVNPKYKNLNDYILRIPELMESKEGEVIHNGRNLIKKFTAPDGTVVSVKRYHKAMFLNRVVYSLGIRKPKGLRAYQYPFRLQEKNISTPESIAYIEERYLGLLGFSYFVCVHCPYTHRMYEFGDAEEGSYEDFAIAFGRFTAMMHDREVLHRDYSPGNILWEKNGNGFSFCLVDINRMSFRHIGMEDGLRNLSRIWGPKGFFLMIVDAYAEARGFDRDVAETVALDARAKFWSHFGKKHKIKFKLEL